MYSLVIYRAGKTVFLSTHQTLAGASWARARSAFNDAVIVKGNR